MLKDVVAPADCVIARIREVGGDVLVFSSGHFVRVLAARWIGGDRVAAGWRFVLATASLSALSYEQRVPGG